MLFITFYLNQKIVLFEKVKKNFPKFAFLDENFFSLFQKTARVLISLFYYVLFMDFFGKL